MFRLEVSGMLGRDPETRTYGDGKTLTRFSVATRVRNKGETETVWVSVTAFGKLAELAAKYLKKRSRVLAIGTPAAKVYTNKNEEVMASIEMVADDIEFLDPPTGGDGSQGYTPVDTDVPF